MNTCIWGFIGSPCLKCGGEQSSGTGIGEAVCRGGVGPAWEVLRSAFSSMRGLLKSWKVRRLSRGDTLGRPRAQRLVLHLERQQNPLEQVAGPTQQIL